MSWAPFNSIINNHDIMYNIKEQETYINRPAYIEEQLEELELKIMNAYTYQDTITINYYHDHKSLSITGNINKIDAIYKRIKINNINISFFDIISVN